MISVNRERILRWQWRINHSVTLVLVVCLVSVLAWLSVRYQVEMDWTKTGRHSLSHASQHVLSKLDGTVDVIAYVRPNQHTRQQIRRFVAYYQHFKPTITLQFINPDAVPDEVRQTGISANGELLLRYHGRTQHVKRITEEQFTNALERLLRSREHWITFIEGHGERDALGRANHDLGMWSKQLVARGFKVQPLNLAIVKDIPNNTKLVVLAAPQIKLLAGEVSSLMRYLSRGGNMLWLAEPNDMHGLEPLAEQLGVEILDGTVIDSATSLLGIDDPTIVVSTPSLYPDHIITNTFDYTTFFPRTAAIRVKDGTGWHKSLLLTSATHTWLETGKLDDKISYDAASDSIGPFEIGVSLHKDRADTSASVSLQQRVIVVGDGDFLSNAYVNNGGNFDLGLRLINWLSEDDEFIDIPTKVVNDAHLELSLAVSIIISFGFVLLLPTLFLLTASIIYWRRQRQ